MKREALNTFLSRENIDLHFDFLKNLRLKLSIIKKSYPKLFNDSSIFRNRYITGNIPETVISEADELLSNIKMHELYFDSFSLNREKCPKIKRLFSSEESFLYEFYSLIQNSDCGYAFVYIDKKGRLEMSLEHSTKIYLKYDPLLVIDLYEHSYFYDYRYDKERYFRKALECLDLRKIEDALSFS